jgi:signal transduction histidine kinase
LSFLVNDMLDFAQMRSGKFRKDLSTFDIRVAIEEIVNIQILKAEHIGLRLTSIMLNF